MNRIKSNTRKYNSLHDKIKDYHLRRLQTKRDPNTLEYSKEGGYSKEYYALNKAKKDIKDKIKEHLEAALVFSEIIRMGEFSQSSRKHDPEFQELDKDLDLVEYELTGDQGSVREEISNESKEFFSDIFNEDVIRRLLRAIFNHGYRNRTQVKHDVNKEYRIDVAKKMATASINELIENLEPAYSDILSQDLKRTIDICNAIQRKISDKEMKAVRVPRLLRSKH